MGAAEDVEGLLEIAIVRQRAPVSGKQRLVLGLGDRRLLEHGDRLGALPGGAQRLCVLQRRLGVLGVGAIAIAIGVEIASRIGGAACFGLLAQRARDVGRAIGLAAAEPEHQDGGRYDGCKTSRGAV